MSKYTFEIGNHTEKAHEYTSELIDEAYLGETTAQTRVGRAKDLCEAHYSQVGQMPSQGVLSRLAWYIVFDEMTDDHPDKMTREEYPIASGKQLFRRKDRYSLKSDIDYDGRESHGRVKRSFITNNGEVWVSNNRLAYPFVDGMEGVVLIDFIRSLIEGAELTERQRQTIEGVYLRGMTQAEVADELGVSRQMVQRHSSVAIDKMFEFARNNGISNLL